jgi:ABC-type multidrug transport system ATPase subunit
LPTVRRPLLIGRSAGCDVVLPLPMVSSRHAVLEPDGDGWRIRDLGSTNGTFVRGQRIDGPARVVAGDVIGLGSCRLRLAADGASLEERDLPGRASLEARAIAVDVGGRRLIEEISLAVAPGEMVAIMGPSGAGKSTLLATLVGARRPDAGGVFVAGADLYASWDEFRGQIGYVPQDDIMHAELTVAQALWFTARLRLPRDYSEDEIRRRIAAVVEQLGLTGSEHVRIGSAERRGISGGQRKRVNVAMELVTDPPLLVLDEPTSGLSSTDALAVVKLLRGLADGGKTVLLTIHQPGSEALRQMDGLALVARDASTREVGQLAWYGPAWPDAARFFEPHGRPDDAEGVLRGLTTRPIAAWRADYLRSATHRDWVERRQGDATTAVSPLPRRSATPLDALAQWWTLVRRSLAVKAADRWTTAILLLQAPIIALLVAGVFGNRAAAPLDHTSWADSAQAVATTTFLMALAAIWFGCSNAAREIVGERAIFRRERMVGLSLTAYLASKLTVLAVLCGIQCGVLLAIVGRGCGLEAAPGGSWLTLFLAANAAVTIGLCLSAVARSAEAAASVLPLVILPMVILGGILMPLAELPRPATFLADAMPSRWAFEALLVGESEARATLELPDSSDPDQPDRTQVVDLAESWFSRTGWRSGSDTPGWMLAGSWLIGVIALHALLQRDAGRRA